MWCIYIADAEQGKRLAIDYYENESELKLNGGCIEKGFKTDDEADKRAKFLSSKICIPPFDCRKNNVK